MEGVGYAHVQTYPVNFQALNYHPQNENFYNVAFKMAITDGLLNEDDRPHVRFVVIE